MAVLNILVYTGAKMLIGSSTDSTLPQSVHIVMHLMEPYLDEGHHVFTDRYYSSVPLVQALQQRNTSFTGTCNKSRVLLPDVIRQPLHLPDNGVLAYRCDRLLCLAWRAPQKTTHLTMLSSESSAKMCTVQPRRRNTEPVQKPTLVDLYNHNMNGVDVADQLAVYYPFITKTRKWWCKLALWLLETAVVNSYIVFKQVCQNTKMTHLTYRSAVVE